MVPTGDDLLRRVRGRLALPLALALCQGCTADGSEGPPVARLELGASLEATLDDPVYLTFAAARPRSGYLPDEGYALVREASGALAFESDQGGMWGVAAREGGRLLLPRDADTRLRYLASDGAVAQVRLDSGLELELRFAVVSSRVARLDVVVRNASDLPRTVELLPWVRRCGGPYRHLQVAGPALRFAHPSAVDALTRITAPGSFLEAFVDELRVDGGPSSVEVSYAGAGACGGSLSEDLGRLVATGTVPSEAAVVVGRTSVALPPRKEALVRVLRGVHGAGESQALAAELGTVAQQELAPLFEEGQRRLAAWPELRERSREDRLVYRAGLALVDQLVMPPEGKLETPYFLFSREPLFYFSRIGQHIQEGLSLILLAHAMPTLAMDALRVFLRRVEPDGYLPYNIGPKSSVTMLRTASAPLLSYAAMEVYRITKDRVFLREAYEAGERVHAFWERERDTDHDGLAEWGGWTQIEPVPDSTDIVWKEVAPPEAVESVALNSMLVREEKSLAAMATALGRADEASRWEAVALRRAKRVNEVMWDAETGFYYNVKRETETFTFAKENDLKREEQWGFLPLWAGIVPPDRLDALLRRLTDPKRFWRACGVPSLSAADPSYSTVAGTSRWDGPVWLQWQYLFLRPLREAGRAELARELRDRTVACVKKQLSLRHQLMELYHPDDPAAENTSHPNYIWTALVSLMLLDPA